MTPGARIQAAAEILELWLDGEAAEKALTGWARRSRFAGSKDRAAIRDHVFDAIRCKRSYAALGGALTGRGLMIGMARAQQLEIADLFSGQGHAPDPLSEAELVSGDAAQGAAALDLPDWLEPIWRDSLGAQAEAAALAQQTRAPVMLRVNLRKSDIAQARAALSAEGIETHPVEMSDTALLVETGARKVALSQAFQTGLVELQDGASQAVVDALPLTDGLRVLDYCAGGGGKTLAMAGRVDARFSAHDINEGRLRDLPDRAVRAGVEVALLPAGDVQGDFDLVLCDAPCSGSGSWRRAPDGKWRLSAAQLQQLTEMQRDILDQAAGLVAANGVLAYATCSLLECENGDQVTDFLKRHPGWTETLRRQWLPGAEGDGFFLSCLTGPGFDAIKGSNISG
ncbi:Ribosomal RNA small subunit methyltransferase B [Thalassovita gelatinovora]|uniref:Ribosomal RNA small subunit methyltransferase B n=1 Tax=Thalassovita gelatinovora TaxID=53501 RepID=A0A0P1FEC9_THAGE|nr:RsmB/NOP family class I SAM-dependent RNA methyltransferase [Thalassovita gelatinovora]QIZ79621.1 RsmB/NOP family class I SAM-dependent RNA methyltransferase [Thalassovita gelatinovora]CUH66556.1 Ribosomal RNA small subunit methyltransferase B [Thalassovita gelatinovora]SEQ37850.1 16S rRNA (cytosine967-C5)-methyltransferase [Thalassovita gelatinovora]